MRLVAHKPDNECTVSGPHRADECWKQLESDVELQNAAGEKERRCERS